MNTAEPHRISARLRMACRRCGSAAKWRRAFHARPGSCTEIMRNITFVFLLVLSSVLLIPLFPALQAAKPAAPWLSETAPGSFYGTDIPGRAPKLHGAPYVTQVTPTSALVNWMVRVGPISLGESPDQLTT